MRGHYLSLCPLVPPLYYSTSLGSPLVAGQKLKVPKRQHESNQQQLTAAEATATRFRPIVQAEQIVGKHASNEFAQIPKAQA